MDRIGIIKEFSRDTMENLFALETPVLTKLLLSELPRDAFEESARNYSPPKHSYTNCKFRAPSALSRLKPQVYLRDDLTTIEARATSARALWLMASQIFSDPMMDVADLSAWFESGFQFQLKFVPESFIKSYSNDRQMIRLGGSEGLHGLSTLRPLRKLVFFQ